MPDVHHNIKLSLKQEKELIRLYLEEKKDSSIISKIFKIHRTTVIRYLKRNNIQPRTNGEAKKLLPSAFKGKKHSLESRNKISLANRGKRFSQKTEFKKGNIPWFIKHNLPHPALGHTKEGLRGENHPNWKGGITPQVIKLRNSPKYAQWRMNVFERDEFICQDCGYDKGHILNAHHIIPFSECIKLDWEEEIFDIDNGLTLCKPCHDGGGYHA